MLSFDLRCLKQEQTLFSPCYLVRRIEIFCSVELNMKMLFYRTLRIYHACKGGVETSPCGITVCNHLASLRITICHHLASPQNHRLSSLSNSSESQFVITWQALGITICHHLPSPWNHHSSSLGKPSVSPFVITKQALRINNCLDLASRQIQFVITWQALRITV